MPFSLANPYTSLFSAGAFGSYGGFPALTNGLTSSQAVAWTALQYATLGGFGPLYGGGSLLPALLYASLRRQPFVCFARTPYAPGIPAAQAAPRQFYQARVAGLGRFRDMRRLKLTHGALAGKMIRPFWDQYDVLSNFAHTPFTMNLGGKPCRYNFAEQVFQEAKVRFVLNQLPRNDWRRQQKCHALINDIRGARSGDEARRIAQTVERYPFPFDGAAWGGVSESIMRKIVHAKAAQCPEMKATLLATGDDLLVEASPSDNRWGIGLAETDKRIFNSDNWGLATANGAPANHANCNQLGNLLMEERTRLRTSQRTGQSPAVVQQANGSAGWGFPATQPLHRPPPAPMSWG